MKLSNFERHIDQTIIARGFDYYQHHHIVDQECQGDGEYVFWVEGSDIYEVVVKINKKGTIVHSFCDCPYDFGPVCKHQVAAFYALADKIKEKTSAEGRGMEKSTPTLKEVLQSLSKERLIAIIEDIARNDRVLKDKIMLNYSQGYGDELNQCKRYLKTIVRKYRGGENGFIVYDEAYTFAQELSALTKKIKDTDSPIVALEMALLVLKEAIQALEYADDSDGYIGEVATDMIEIIRDKVDHARKEQPECTDEMFRLLLQQCDHSVMVEWDDFRFDILRICADFADCKTYRERLRKKIRRMLEQAESDYTRKELLHVLFDLIQTYDSEEEAAQFITAHLRYPSFRKICIKRYLQEENYTAVIDLALEGERQDKDYKGLVIEWKKIRYHAYQKLEWQQEQEKLARELFLDGEFEYYRELKALHSGQQKELYRELIQALKQDLSWHHKTLYLRLIETERDTDELMAYVRQNPASVEKYASLLVKEFRHEVIKIYQAFIHEKAKTAMNRKNYRDVCQTVQSFGRIAGKTAQNDIIHALRTLYKRKPAFLDELNKIK
jgi:hypothetical protein